MRVLVIGGAGFVGRHLVDSLRNDGCDVISVDPRHQLDTRWSLRAQFQEVAVQLSKRRFTRMVHLGADILDVDSRVKRGWRAYTDITLDQCAIAFAERSGVEKSVFMSSCAIDNPEDPYGWTKLTLERMLRGLDARHVALRPFSGYGADQDPDVYPFPAILRRAMRQEDPLDVWGGDQVRDWLHVDDLVGAVRWAMATDLPSEPIEVGTGVGTRLDELARRIASACGYAPELRSLDKEKSSMRRVADTSKAAALGWISRVPLEAGIARCVQEAVA